MPTGAPSAPAYVQSLEAAAAKAVAATSISAGWVQWMELADPSSHHRLTVFSYAGANPVPAALVDLTGAHLTVLSVHVGGTVSAVASVIGQPTVTASVPGTVTVIGSVQATQQGSWTVTANQGGTWTVQPTSTGAAMGTVVASVIGQPTVTASVVGIPTVIGSVQATQATSPWVTLPGSTGALFQAVGSVGATQLGAPWSTTGSVQATQAGSWTVTVAASGVVAAVHSDAAGGMLRVLVASQAGGGSTITGSVNATLVGSSLVGVLGTNGLQAGVSSFGGDGHLLRIDLVRGSLTGANGAILDGVDATIAARVASLTGGGALYVIVASQIGGGSTVTGSVWASQANTPWLVTGSVQATQATSPWVTLPGSTGAVFQATGSMVATQGGAPWTTTGSVQATQQGSWTVTVAASGVIAAVHSDAAGGMLRVLVASQAGGGSTITGSVWASQANTPWLVTGSVQATQATSPWVTLPGSTGAVFQAVGSILASQGGAPWSVTGSVRVTAAESWTMGVVATSGTTVGALTATSHAAGPLLRVDVVQQAGSTSTESVRAIQQGSWTVTANQGGAPWTTVASVIGQPTVTASIVGTIAASISGTVVASVIGVPTIIGSVAATPAGSWTVGVIATSGTTVGALTATSHATGALLRVDVVQQAGSTSTESVFATQQGSWVVTANQGGAPWTTVASVIGIPTIIGSVGATQLGAPWTVTGSVVATQGAAPWTTVASVIGTIAASVSGTVVASVIGQPTVTASVIGTIAASVTGTVVASMIGTPTVVASVIGIPTVIGSVGATQLGVWSVHIGNSVVSIVGSVATAPAISTARMAAIATTASSVLAHPYDGATAMVRSATAVGSVTVYLASDVWTGDLRGFALLFASSGGAQGVVRTIVSLSNSLVATVDSPWETGRTPHSGQVYKVLVDARNVEMATVATELSSNNNYVWGTIAQYTIPQSGSATVKPWLDTLRIIDNLQTSLEVLQSSYWQGQARTLVVRGAVGFKYLVTSVTGGAYSIWAGAS